MIRDYKCSAGTYFMNGVEIELRNKSLLLEKSPVINSLVSRGNYVTGLLEEKKSVHKLKIK